MIGLWDVEVKCQVELVGAHLLVLKSVDDRALAFLLGFTKPLHVAAR